MARQIGIRHRVKRTATDEARPTLVAVSEQGKPDREYELEDETAELDFLLGRFPTAWRAVEDDEDLSGFPGHHVMYRKLKDDEEPASFNSTHLKKSGKKFEVASKVPAKCDGLAAGDDVYMIFGGSGDRFAFALSRRGEEIGARVHRIPPFLLKDVRGDAAKEDDHKTLVDTSARHSDLFYTVDVRDRALIQVQEAYRARKDAQQDRIRCEQRLRQQAIGQIFLSSDGRYPEGTIEDAYDKICANDVILSAIEKEEGKREAELRRAVATLDIWHELFKPIEGCGEVLAAGIITPIADIRRFETPAKLKAFCGAHVLPDGRFARKRSGSVANWNPTARQALYLLADQWVKRPDSEWGKRLREYKAKFRAKRPEVVVVDGKKRYTNGHIHKMAIWRTITKFVEHIFKRWTAIDKRHREKEAQAA